MWEIGMPHSHERGIQRGIEHPCSTHVYPHHSEQWKFAATCAAAVGEPALRGLQRSMVYVGRHQLGRLTSLWDVSGHPVKVSARFSVNADVWRATWPGRRCAPAPREAADQRSLPV